MRAIIITGTGTITSANTLVVSTCIAATARFSKELQARFAHNASNKRFVAQPRLVPRRARLSVFLKLVQCILNCVVCALE